MSNVRPLKPMSFPVSSSQSTKVRRRMTGGFLGACCVGGFVERSSLLVRPGIAAASLIKASIFSSKHSLVSSGAAPGGAEKQMGSSRVSSWQRCGSNGLSVQGFFGSLVLRAVLLPLKNLASTRALRPNPSVNTDASDNAACAGYVKR